MKKALVVLAALVLGATVAAAQEASTAIIVTPQLGCDSFYDAMGGSGFVAYGPAIGASLGFKLDAGWAIGVRGFASFLFQGAAFQSVSGGGSLLVEYMFDDAFGLQLGLGYPCGLGAIFGKDHVITLEAFPQAVYWKMGISYGYRLRF